MHVKELMSLKDKVVLVTGGAGLYGRCILEAVAEADGTVISASRNLRANEEAAEELNRRGLEAHAMKVDQGDHQSVLQLKEEIKSKFGTLDVFINNSVYRPMTRYEDPLQAWEESMKINATGMFDIVREMADLMTEDRGGVIVNVGSIYGVFGPDFSLYEGTDMDAPPDYSFHKGGMVALTHYLARKLASRKIRVNCVSPGGLYSGQNERFLERYNRKTPAGRMARHDDIKGLIVFLSSPASSYMTGENILIDGGLFS
jgi:NAD(P)-dependent dehydrogenase (short-subunit alcohol dehydrogenase family)